MSAHVQILLMMISAGSDSILSSLRESCQRQVGKPVTIFSRPTGAEMVASVRLTTVQTDAERPTGRVVEGRTHARCTKLYSTSYCVTGRLEKARDAQASKVPLGPTWSETRRRESSAGTEQVLETTPGTCPQPAPGVDTWRRDAPSDLETCPSGKIGAKQPIRGRRHKTSSEKPHG